MAGRGVPAQPQTGACRWALPLQARHPFAQQHYSSSARRCQSPQRAERGLNLALPLPSRAGPNFALPLPYIVAGGANINIALPLPSLQVARSSHELSDYRIFPCLRATADLLMMPKEVGRQWALDGLFGRGGAGSGEC